ATTGTQGYTVVKNDWKKAVKQLQDGLKDNSIGKITVSFNDGVVGEVAPKSANKKADRDAAAEKLYNLVNTQLDKLGDGDYVDFSVDYNLENKIITNQADAEAIVTKLNSLNEKTLIDIATKDTFGMVSKTQDSEGKNVAATKALKVKDVATFGLKSGGSEDTGYVVEMKAGAVEDKYGKVGDSTAGIAINLPSTGLEYAGKGTTIDFNKTLKVDVTGGSTPSAVAVSGFVTKDDTDLAKSGTINVRVINAKEESIDIDASSYTSAENLAKRYVFDPDEISEAYKAIVALQNDGIESNLVQLVNGKYQVIFYPEGKRLE
nr:Chain A, S-layer protein [Clostridioides difficile 630]7ACY_C Chain C, S-layer protein [Clostridioides difficile 630]7QGQ_A Chain A, Precursor of the S-layer proteins [Clostridioides difficile 630]7QGQ_C Chain C, Precursor of the S-layer proteins [Clostridioides difficile 630]7QGQ_E Chain E, Precursor of the S-layer proteins [Clostridioides difficile 630]7QGQ_F Chain F, Precursor of the S-layer proteins [Clostridioides difficile 630]7QGQ_G Chain G, Precursor of the S-layer proteins [Clostr